MPITELQRQQRRKFLGSSDSPIIMNLSPFKKTASDIYWSKVAPLIEDNTPEYMQIGNWLEGPLLQWAAQELGVEIDTNPADLFCVAHEGEGKDLFAANHDSLIQHKMGQPREGIEAKYANGEMAQEYGEPFTDQIPYHVIVQVQHQMYVSQLSRVYVALAVPSYYAIDRSLYIIQRDEELIKTIVNFGRQWWYEHIEAKIPPDGQGVPPLYVLKALDRRAQAQIRLPEEAVQWANNRIGLKQQVKALSVDIEDIDAKLIHALSDAEIGLLPDGRKVTYFRYEQNRFDSKQFNLDHPELLPDYMKRSDYRTLYIKKK